jgi:twinkle protein
MNAAELNAALAARTDDLALYLFPQGRREGREWVIGDLTGLPGKSCKICLAGPKAGMFCDFSTGEKGGPLDAWMGARQVDFKTSMREAAAWLGVSRPLDRKTPSYDGVSTSKPKPLTPIGVMPPEGLERARLAAERLAGDLDLCARIAAARGWKPETVRSVALDACLGWEEGKLVFVYQTGLKARWKDVSGQRVIRFLCGNASELWRGWLLSERITKVFVCEGETDAISMIDAGAEIDDNVLVVSLPSASTIPADIAQRLAGKDAVVCVDNDKAGRDARLKLLAALDGHVATLKTFTWRQAA